MTLALLGAVVVDLLACLDKLLDLIWVLLKLVVLWCFIGEEQLPSGSRVALMYYSSFLYLHLLDLHTRGQRGLRRVRRLSCAIFLLLYTSIGVTRMPCVMNYG